MNRVSLIGRIAKDIELKQTNTGKNVCQFTLAVNKGYGQEGADFISCVAWNKTAEYLAQYIKKGFQISVDGRLSTRSYDGQYGKVYVTEVVCDSVENLTPKQTQPKPQQQNLLDAPPIEYPQHNNVDISPDALPFY